MNRGTGRRLLAALAGSTPSFTSPASREDQGPGRRLLAALAGSTPAFAGHGASDTYSGSSRYAGSALEGFANRIADLPPAERLAARIWLPETELAIIRMLATARDGFLSTLVLPASAPGSDDLDTVVDLIRAIARALSTLNEPASFGYGHVLESILQEIEQFTLRLSVSLDRYLTGGGHPASELNRAIGRMSDRARTLARLAILRRRHPGSYDPGSARLKAEVTRDLFRTGALVFVRSIRTHKEVIELARAVDHDTVWRADWIALGMSWVAAVDRLLSVTTDMAGADLSQVDLRRVPLDGVRWSTLTRWPPELATWVREHSVTVSPGLYEIRIGRSDVPIPV